MFFSIGDLITLVVVLLILVIFRALDRNNRSLEKLKRFSNKITENLSVFVEAKTTQVRDLSLELQAGLKTGGEIIARARSIEELLQGKTAETESIEKRLAEYDRALSELTAMSARVDKNLQKLREESAFVDAVDRRIGESAARLDKVEKKIPALEQGFAAHARKSLDAARGEVLGSMDQRIGALAGGLVESEKKLKDFSAYIARLEAREGQTEKERRSALARTLDAFDADLRGRLSKAVRQGETLEDEVFARLSARIQSDESALGKSIETIELRLADYQGDVDYRVKSLEEANNDVDALRAALAETMDKMAAGVRVEMKDAAAALVAGWKSEIAGAAAAREQLHAGMAEVEAGVASLKTRAYQDVEKRLSVFEEEFFADLRARSSGMQEKFQAWQAETEKRAVDFEAGIKERAADFEAGVKERTASVEADVNARVESLKADVKERAASVEADVNARVESLEADVKEHAAAAGDSVQALREALSEDVERARKDASMSFEKNLGGVRDMMEAETRKMHREIEARLEALSAELNAGRTELAELFEASRAEMAAWEGGAMKQLAEAELANAGTLSTLSSRIQADEAALAKSIETIELRLADYQGDVDYRVKVLEDANRDVDALRTSLSQTMDKMAEGVRAEMKGLAEELATGWKSDVAGAAIAREQLQAGMGELEAGLEELKARAYQDAEKKLSVFEEEFFTDLRARSTMTQEKFQAWQVEMEKRAASFEADVRERTADADEAVQALREALRGDVEKARKDASMSFEKDLGGVKDVMEAATRKMHREIETRLKELSVELNAGRKELTELFEASRSEIATWESGAKKQLAEAELTITDKISSLSAEASSSVGTIRDAFAAQKEDLLVSTNEERIGLRKELAQMGETISSYEAVLKKTTEAAMEALRTQMDGFQLESQKRVREVQTEVEGRIKEQKQLLADTKEKADAMQEKLYGRIEESYQLLSTNLVEIDKRVKSFTSQTRLFERADTLKAALEVSIDEMKKEVAKLNADRAEFAEIEVQLTKTKKVAEEVSSKLTRFLSERRRIDDMDTEFKKIIALSRDVDLKLDTLSASSDALQQIQAKVRQFEEMGKSVEGGFERLEKKKEILSVTSEGVDRNFQRLEGIEKSVQEADRAADTLAIKVQSLRGEYEMLAANKKDADSAMQIVGKLSGVIEELESRMEKAQSSREWMARTETRFEEIGRQAQEQVRLLESIMKAETRKEKGDRGAPPMDKRETVIKLSHQGWSVQEISRVTQLSRGEVELILELAPKV